MRDLTPKARWIRGVDHGGRTVYSQPGEDEPGRADDVLIGVMDTPALAELVVTAVNEHLAVKLDREPPPARAEVLHVGNAAIRDLYLRQPDHELPGQTLLGAALDALHEVGMLAYRTEADHA